MSFSQHCLIVIITNDPVQPLWLIIIISINYNFNHHFYLLGLQYTTYWSLWTMVADYELQQLLLIVFLL